MKFPKINDDFCPTTGPTLGCEDDRCADPAFAAAHPELCGSTGKLILKPGRMILCAQNELQFLAFLSGDNGEQPLTAGVTFTSADTSILTINSSSGLATVVGVGDVIVSATWQGTSATSLVTVLAGAGDCCSGVAVRAAVLWDQSNSMYQEPMAGPWSTKSAFANYLWKYGVFPGMTYRDNQNVQHGDGKSFEAIVDFARTPFLRTDWDAPPVASTPDRTRTDIAAAFQFAIDLFGTVPADDQGRELLKVIVLLSDGTNQPALGTDAFYDLLQQVNDFRANGGVVVAIGFRAAGQGFTLLKEVADPGFFFNANPDNYGDALAELQTMMCGLCATVLGERECQDVERTELIPAMASNTTPSGNVLRYFDPTLTNTPVADDYLSMDGNDSSFAADGISDYGNSLGYDFGAVTTVNSWRIKIQYANAGFARSGKLRLLGTNDDAAVGPADWTEIESRDYNPDDGVLDETFELAAPAQFRAFMVRVECPEDNSYLTPPGYVVKIFTFQLFSENCVSGGHGCGALDATGQVPDPNPLDDVEA